jgi:mRNA interferase MazF
MRAGVMRGGVYWIDLDQRRPCVVVSSDEVLSVNVWQSHVVPVTSNVARAGIAGNVLLPATASGLPKDSVAVPLGLELIDRSILGERSGRLPQILVDDIDEGLRAILGL